MSSITFDTLKFATRLEKTGVEREQAEVHAQALAEIVDANLAELVTKRDLQLELVPIRKDIELLEQRMNARFTLLQWMLGLLLGGMISLMIKAFFS